MFYKKDVLGNFTKFTGKHLCQSLFFNKVAGLRPASLLKKETLTQMFSCEFREVSKDTFSQNTSRHSVIKRMVICNIENLWRTVLKSNRYLQIKTYSNINV